MEYHVGAFSGLGIGILISILISLTLWANHKTWSIILIILLLFFGVMIGDYFDRKNLKKKKHLFDM